MIVVYKSEGEFKALPHREFGRPVALDRTKKWHIGIDGSSTSFGLAVYTNDNSINHLFIFIRDVLETADSFRAILFSWMQDFLYGIEFDTATYERTPEGYKPPSSHAEKVMRDSETAVRNFLTDRNYVTVSGREWIFDIFPNSWKFFSVEKSSENVGKVNKRENAKSVLESVGKDPQSWLKEFDRLPYSHDYDCFEALGIGRYGSHFLKTEDGSVRVFKNFSRIGPIIAVAKQINLGNLANELNFVGTFGNGRTPRFSSLNKNHSVIENILGLYDDKFNNILTVPGDDELSIHLDMMFGFKREPSKSYLIMSSRTSKTKASVSLCEIHDYKYAYW